MKGSIAIALKEMIEKNFGEDKWNDTLIESGLTEEPHFTAVSDVDDKLVMKMINGACTALKITLLQAADAFGDYWVNEYSQKLYKPYYRQCNNAQEFLLSMNSVHSTVTRRIENAKPPVFEYEKKDDKTLIMKYRSERGMIDFMIGLIKGVGKYYNEKLTILKMSETEVKITFS
ncbi:MAG TPA: heme NO-binding domain-containing protein [Leptospiraceae bacterium]|nr:heme NO-binding domain-containing protein [Leptospiraceae bacterium]HMY68949.1 heme NO-binding domain-containing protein [Leptospiraceae bacterium]HMZ57229.1 heme NO-binding domain-containing protein [Leptospiraceae bacterium]HNF16190.1 heme NO-binding domain-containing protein [Leptospiraceae bacterium]HNF23534.1 heme NO-binding domain-containing protein [Leptospiraceae bacterium]